MSDRLDQLRKLHAASPDDAFLTYGIALELAKAGQPREAVDWLDRTLANDPSYHYAFFQKGKALSELGEEEQAMATLRAGIERATADGDAKAAGELRDLLMMIE